MPRRKVVRGEGETRRRILRAAMVRFSKAPYEQVGLREVAADVGVDVAYVHRSFTSKERLFAECVKGAGDRSGAFLAGTGNPVDSLVRQLFRPRKAHEVRSLDIVIQSLSSPDAARVLRRIAPDFITQLAAFAGDRSATRATLALALLAGVGILRNVIGISTLVGSDDREVARLVRRAMRDILRLERRRQV